MDGLSIFLFFALIGGTCLFIEGFFNDNGFAATSGVVLIFSAMLVAIPTKPNIPTNAQMKEADCLIMGFVSETKPYWKCPNNPHMIFNSEFVQPEAE